jgi:MoaA/NifB/PqqE/SkfB family radical SAM enzyme
MKARLAFSRMNQGRKVCYSLVRHNLGGETLLHPEINEILQLLLKQNRSYTLFSNGILADELIETCREFNVKNLIMSCDGPRETYKRVRGIDNYDNIVRIVNELKDKTNISIDYTANPLNTREDLVKVKDFCDLNGIYLGVGPYDNIDYFDTTMPKQKLYDVEGLATYPADKFIRLYNDWMYGDIKLPCYSIRFSCAILPDGSVIMCVGKEIVLGNLNEISLSKIWNSNRTKEIQHKYKNCNGCWILCQRSYDVGLAIILRHSLPKKLLNYMLGNYDWGKI